MADTQTLILQLQADWFGLHYLARARRITASAAPAAYFKRPYRNCPGTEPRPILPCSWGSHDRVLTYFDRFDG